MAPSLRPIVLGLLSALAVAAAGPAVASRVTAAKTKHHVTIKRNYSSGYHFKPRKLIVKRGTTVTWSWNSDAPHNVHVHGRKHHSRTDTTVKHFRLKFKHAGTFKYKCTVHGFKGKIVVVK